MRGARTGLGRTGFSIALMAGALLTATSVLAEPVQTFKTQKVDVKVETVATGLDHPWAAEVLPDGAYLVTERPGRIRLIRETARSQALYQACPKFTRMVRVASSI